MYLSKSYFYNLHTYLECKNASKLLDKIAGYSDRVKGQQPIKVWRLVAPQIALAIRNRNKTWEKDALDLRKERRSSFFTMDWDNFWRSMFKKKTEAVLQC